MSKVNLSDLIASKEPQLLEKVGEIEIYKIDNENFPIASTVFKDLYDSSVDKLKDDNIIELNVLFVKKIFPILTNIDISKMTDIKIKKIVENPSRSLENAMVVLYKYFGEFVEDFTKFNEKVSELPKKDFDILVKNEDEKVAKEIFKRNKFDEDEFVKEFTEKYLSKRG